MSDEDKNKPKDAWDKAKIASGFLTPLVLLVVGYVVNMTIMERESALRRFEIATNVMQGPADDDSPSILRAWAAMEFQEYTGVLAANFLEFYESRYRNQMCKQAEAIGRLKLELQNEARERKKLLLDITEDARDAAKQDNGNKP